MPRLLSILALAVGLTDLLSVANAAPGKASTTSVYAPAGNAASSGVVSSLKAVSSNDKTKTKITITTKTTIKPTPATKKDTCTTTSTTSSKKLKTTTTKTTTTKTTTTKIKTTTTKATTKKTTTTKTGKVSSAAVTSATTPDFTPPAISPPTTRKTTVSTGKVSSSVRSSSVTASGPRITDSIGCSPYSTTTSTITERTYLVGATSSDSFTFTSYYAPSTVSVFTPTYSITYTTVYTSTRTIGGQTTTTTVPVVVDATSITTVATPPGFTPVLCLPAWRNPRVTTTVTIFTTTYIAATVTTTATPTYTYPSYTSTSTSTIETISFTYISNVYTGVTSTRTRSTAYAACATNNIVDRGPQGGPLSIPQLALDVEFVVQPAASPFDCCELCQANELCVGSSAAYPDGPNGRVVCQFNSKRPGSANASTCDPQFVGASISNSQGSIGFDIIISDSACGQYS